MNTVSLAPIGLRWLPCSQLLGRFATRHFWLCVVGVLSGNAGNRLYGVPRHGGSLWLTYRPPQGALRGLELGLGAIARSERQGDNANDYQLPGFTTWKALVAYGWRTTNAQFNLQLNVDNIFNTRYFESLSGGPSVVPGCPRRWLMSVRAEL